MTQLSPFRSCNSSLRVLGFALAFFLFVVFFSLGTWQLYRLDYKHELIDRVESRVGLPPVQAPAQDQWSSVSRETQEYRSVKVQGEFLVQYTTRVQAATVLGAGHWLMTPLRNQDGDLVWINRGFIPATQSDPMTIENTQGQFEVRGLLRITEADGAFLRKNNPSNNRWYSRDTAALSEHHGLKQTAPYFIDVGRPRNLGEEMTGFEPKNYPVDGLTVIKFRNNHMVYAITWYALALMVLGLASIHLGARKYG